MQATSVDNGMKERGDLTFAPEKSPLSEMVRHCLSRATHGRAVEPMWKNLSAEAIIG